MHLLPIYPSSGDGGFAPLTYTEVDPHFGTWEGGLLLLHRITPGSCGPAPPEA